MKVTDTYNILSIIVGPDCALLNSLFQMSKYSILTWKSRTLQIHLPFSSITWILTKEITEIQKLYFKRLITRVHLFEMHIKNHCMNKMTSFIFLPFKGQTYIDTPTPCSVSRALIRARVWVDILRNQWNCICFWLNCKQQSKKCNVHISGFFEIHGRLVYAMQDGFR